MRGGEKVMTFYLLADDVFKNWKANVHSYVAPSAPLDFIHVCYINLK